MDQGRLSAVLATLVILAGAPAAAAEHAAPLPRVLALFDDDPEVTLANSVFQMQLRSAFTSRIELRTEHFDGGQLSRRAYREAFRQWLSIRYADLPPQLVVALGEDAVGLLADPA